MAALLLLGATLVQFAGLRRGQPTVSRSLANRLPAAVPGWTARDLPVAESPEVQRATESILRYDEVIYREFKQDDQVFQVYVSQWRPGKMDPLEIAVHNPDTCWMANGWTRLNTESHMIHELGGMPVGEGRFRAFSNPAGHRVEVIYWLIVGQTNFRVVDDHTWLSGLATRALTVMQNAWVTASTGNSPQPICFVRVASSQNLEKILSAPAVRQLNKELRSLIDGR